MRWSGTILAPATGTYRFQTVSDDGIRLWVNGVQLINNWTAHSSTTNTSGTINLVAGTRYTITLEYYEGARHGGSPAALADARRHQLRRHSDQPAVPELIRRAAISTLRTNSRPDGRP